MRVAFVLLVCLISSGCGDVDKALDELEKLRQEVAKTREDAKVVAQAAIRAVPGERWLQIIDDLNGPDAGKRKTAQKYLDNLSHRKTEAGESEVSFAFGFDETRSQPFRFDTLRAISTQRVHVLNFLETGAAAFRNARNTLAPPMSSAQLDDEMGAKAESLMGLLGGDPRPIVIEDSNSPLMPSRLRLVLGWIGSISSNAQAAIPHQPNVDVTTKQIELAFSSQVQQANDRRKEAAQLLKQLILSHYQSRQVVPAENLTISWPTPGTDFFSADTRHCLFLMIPESDFQAHKGDKQFHIEAWIHQRGKPDIGVDGRLPRHYSFTRDEFLAHDAATNKDYNQTVRYAVHDLTGEGDLPLETLTRIREAQTFLTSYQQLSGGDRASEKKK